MHIEVSNSIASPTKVGSDGSKILLVQLQLAIVTSTKRCVIMVSIANQYSSTHHLWN